MNSLRTDDILGAKPRVRHMPRNLIRERQVPTSFLLNFESNPEQALNSSRFRPDPADLGYSPIQQQNNDPSDYPFYARNRLNKEAKYVNYDFARLQQQGGPEPVQAREAQSQLMRAASESRGLQEGSSYSREIRRYEQEGGRLQP